MIVFFPVLLVSGGKNASFVGNAARNARNEVVSTAATGLPPGNP